MPRPSTTAQLYDISPLIHAGLAVYPGDTAYSRQVLMSYERGDHLLLSAVTSTLHLGAHTDAPNHYHPEGAAMAERSLSYYWGPCEVIAARPSSSDRRLYVKDLPKRVIRAPRVLFKTGSFPDPDHWQDDFAALSPELIDWLAGHGVCLVGIDTPSIDPADSQKLESHAAVFAHDMAILEGIVLEHVPEGAFYELAALPLRLAAADASPVRAVLRQMSPP